MKKVSVFILLLSLCFSFSACQQTLHASELYTFPEAEKQLELIRHTKAGAENTVLIEGEDAVSSVADWFYNLNLSECKAPEAEEDSEYLECRTEDETAFVYENRGKDGAYLLIGEQWYSVNNPSAFPMN